MHVVQVVPVCLLHVFYTTNPDLNRAYVSWIQHFFAVVVVVVVLLFLRLGLFVVFFWQLTKDDGLIAIL